MKKFLKNTWIGPPGCAVPDKNGWYHFINNPTLKQQYHAIIESITLTKNLSKAYGQIRTLEEELCPNGKMFTIGFKVYHSETSVMLWVNFDAEFKAKVIDSGLYVWKFVISINDMIPFTYESDGWMMNRIEEDKDNKNVWYIIEPFNIPLEIGSKVKIKCVIMAIETGTGTVISDVWKLGPGDYWDPEPRNRRFIK